MLFGRDVQHSHLGSGTGVPLSHPGSISSSFAVASLRIVLPNNGRPQASQGILPIMWGWPGVCAASGTCCTCLPPPIRVGVLLSVIRAHRLHVFGVGRRRFHVRVRGASFKQWVRLNSTLNLFRSSTPANSASRFQGSRSMRNGPGGSVMVESAASSATCCASQTGSQHCIPTLPSLGC